MEKYLSLWGKQKHPENENCEPQKGRYIILKLRTYTHQNKGKKKRQATPRRRHRQHIHSKIHKNYKKFLQIIIDKLSNRKMVKHFIQQETHGQ